MVDASVEYLEELGIFGDDRLDIFAELVEVIYFLEGATMILVEGRECSRAEEELRAVDVPSILKEAKHGM